MCVPPCSKHSVAVPTPHLKSALHFQGVVNIFQSIQQPIISQTQQLHYANQADGKVAKHIS